MTEYRQIIRGTTIELDAFLGLEGMRAYSTDLKELRVYDGVTLGGARIPNLTTIDTLYALPDRLKPHGVELIASCDTANESGWYSTDAATLNQPVPATAAGALYVGSSGALADTNMVQMWLSGTGASELMYARHRIANVWSAWYQFVDLALGALTYLGLHAVADDSALLNGQNAAFYTNIIARLGYTPINKAGDTMLGALILAADPVTALGAATKQYVDFFVTPMLTNIATLQSKAVRVDLNQRLTFTMAERLVARSNIDVSWDGNIAGLHGSFGLPVTVNITAGECMSSFLTQPAVRLAGAASAKLATSSWAVGSGNGGIDDNASIPITAAYVTFHCFIMARSDTGVVDYCFSLSPTAPSTDVGLGFNIPVQYDRFRRLFSFRINNAGILPWSQRGDEFLLLVPSIDINMAGTLGVAASIVTLASVPTGVQMGALLTLQAYKNAAQVSIMVTSLDQTDTAPTGASYSYFTTGLSGYVAIWTQTMRTDILSRIRLRSDTAASSAFASIRGWIDNRGKDGTL